jgi:hypothetical protein
VLGFFPADEMEAFEVSKDVANVKNNSREPVEQRINGTTNSRARSLRCNPQVNDWTALLTQTGNGPNRAYILAL